ncbi:MAG: anion permease, partial [Acidimicrobiia bacterium]
MKESTELESRRSGSDGLKPSSPPPSEKSSTKTLMRWLIPPIVGLVIYLIPAPAAVEPEGWTLLAIFVATIVAIISKPLPMGAVAFVGLTVAAVMKVFTLDEALSGFSNSVIWLIVIAFLISRAVIK